MRECWINVYERRYGGLVFGGPQASRQVAQWAATIDRRHRPVYRLHVRLKVPALPATDALGAVKAGEDENGRAA